MQLEVIPVDGSSVTFQGRRPEAGGCVAVRRGGALVLISVTATGTPAAHELREGSPGSLREGGEAVALPRSLNVAPWLRLAGLLPPPVSERWAGEAQIATAQLAQASSAPGRAALARLAGLLAPGIAEALRDVGHIERHQCELACDMDPALRARRMDFLRVRPFFASWIGKPEIREAVDRGRPVDGAIIHHLRSQRPSVFNPHLDILRQADQPSPHAIVSRLGPHGVYCRRPEEILTLAWHLRPEVVPSTDDDRRAFAVIANALVGSMLAVSGLMQAGGNVDQSLLQAGRTWRARLERLMLSADPGWAGAGTQRSLSQDLDDQRLLQNALCDIQDWRRAFEAEILAPALARSARLPSKTAYGRERAGVDPAPGLSLRASLDLSRRWHQERHSTSRQAGQDKGWPCPFPPVALGGGLAAIPLSSRQMVVDEGASGPDGNGIPGLDHCVGSFWIAASGGECLLVSLRGPQGARVATLEIERNETGRFMLVQARGRGNRDPAEDVLAAATRLVGWINAGTVPVSDEWLALRPAPREGTLEALAGYSIEDDGAFAGAWRRWQRWLPRRLRDQGPDQMLRDPSLDHAVRTISERLLPREGARLLDNLFDAPPSR